MGEEILQKDYNTMLAKKYKESLLLFTHWQLFNNKSVNTFVIKQEEPLEARV